MTDIVNRLQGVILNAERENSVIHAALEEIQRLRRENQALDAQCAPSKSLGTLWQHSETGRTMVIMRGDPQPRGSAGAPWLFVGTVHLDRDGLDVPEPDPPVRKHAGRWNIDLNNDGSLSVCRGEHEKDAPCTFERFVPAPPENGNAGPIKSDAEGSES